MSSSKGLISAIVFSFVYAAMLTSLPIEGFQDRDNYLVYATSAVDIFLRYKAEGILSILANEPVWLLTNYILGGNAELTVRILIFCGAFGVSFAVVRLFPFGWPVLLVMLLAPQVIKNHIVHLRQGFAIAIFLTAYFFDKRYRFIFLSLAALVHASFFFVAFIYSIVEFFNYFRINGRLLSSRLLVLALICVLSLIVFVVPYVIHLSGARQAIEYSGVDTDGSGLGFVVWFFFLMGFLYQSASWIKLNLFSVGVVIFYLLTYFWLPVTARIFESVMLVVMCSIFNMKGRFKVVFFLALVLYILAQWVVKFNSAFVF